MSDADLTMLSQSLNDRLHAAFNGNAVESATLQVRQQAATHEAANLRVELTLGWKSSWSQETGSVTPNNSKQCADNSDLLEQQNHYINAIIADPVEAKRLEKQYTNNFVGLIAFKESQFNVRPADTQWHYFDRCRNCKGNGVISCNCIHGEIICGSCGGSGTFSTTHVINYVTGEKETRRSNCGGCWGSGRVTCYVCNGTQRLNCRSCDAQGWFTTTFKPKSLRLDLVTVQQMASGVCAIIARNRQDAKRAEDECSTGG